MANAGERGLVSFQLMGGERAQEDGEVSSRLPPIIHVSLLLHLQLNRHNVELFLQIQDLF